MTSLRTLKYLLAAILVLFGAFSLVHNASAADLLGITPTPTNTPVTPSVTPTFTPTQTQESTSTSTATPTATTELSPTPTSSVDTPTPTSTPIIPPPFNTPTATSPFDPTRTPAPPVLPQTGESPFGSSGNSALLFGGVLLAAIAFIIIRTILRSRTNQ